MKHVLYLSYDGMTDPLGQSQVLPYLCGLARRGYRFTLISCEKPDRYEAHKGIIEEITRNNFIDWQPIPYTKKPPILSTVMDIRRMERLAFELHRKDPFVMVHCRGHVPALVGLNLKRKAGLYFLFDMRGFWADEKVDAGAWPLSNPVYKQVYRYFKRKEKAFIDESDHMICLTHKGLAEMHNWKQVQVKDSHVTVIPCCVDTNLFNRSGIGAEAQRHMREGLGISPSDFVVSYLGSIGTWYMLDEMLDFFVTLKKTYPSARFLFITQDEHDRIRRTAAEKGMAPNDIILRPAKRAEVPLVLSLSTYSLFFIRPTYSKISSSPAKQGEIMSMGIPVVCNAGVGDTDMIVERYHSGLLVKDTRSDEYATTVAALAEARFDPAEIRAGALEFFSLEKGVESYVHVYDRILS